MTTPTYSVLIFKAAEIPEAYTAYIFSKWLRSLRFGNPLFKRIDGGDYYSHYHNFIKILLKKPDSIVKIAVLSDDHDVILGFSASREDVLDYIYVHVDYRKTGIGKSLMPEGITTFSHITNTAMQIWQHNPKYKSLKFNPFA